MSQFEDDVDSTPAGSEAGRTHVFNPFTMWGRRRSGAKNEPQAAGDLYNRASYHPIPENWFTAKPYGFRFTPRDPRAPVVVMYLPISPSNLTVSTSFATNATPTLYGTVEEHSPIRYYDIVIEGTTGIGPRYVFPFLDGDAPNTKTMRSSFTVEQAINPDKIKGFGAQTLARINDAKQKAQDLAEKGTDPQTGLKLDQTGYMAFHNLYRFLLEYKKDVSDGGKASPSSDHPLTFFNYKDNNQYKVFIRNFTMKRDKEDPVAYHYSISMRGYDLASAMVGEKEGGADLLNDLGLAGLGNASFLTEAKRKASEARSILASAANGTNQIGR